MTRDGAAAGRLRTLGGGALIGLLTGGVGALIKRSMSEADAIGKTADKIGVGVEALKRAAVCRQGIEQQTLDMRCSASPAVPPRRLRALGEAKGRAHAKALEALHACLAGGS